MATNTSSPIWISWNSFTSASRCGASSCIASSNICSTLNRLPMRAEWRSRWAEGSSSILMRIYIWETDDPWILLHSTPINALSPSQNKHLEGFWGTLLVRADLLFNFIMEIEEKVRKEVKNNNLSWTRPSISQCEEWTLIKYGATILRFSKKPARVFTAINF